MDTHIKCFQDKSSVSDITALDKEIIKYIRSQRHDFMNDIQIIWGYLQLDKSEEAKKYITMLNRNLEVHRSVLNLSNPVLSLFLYDHIVKAGRLGINIDFEMELECMDIDILESDCFVKLVLWDRLFEEVICRILNQKLEKQIFLDIFDESDNIYIVLSTNGHDDFNQYDNMMYNSDIGCETTEAIELAKKSGINASCLFDVNVVAAKMWFSYMGSQL